jgi:hypothetical protein
MLAVLVPIYVVAFYTGNYPFRAVAGLGLLLAIGWLLVWLWRQYLAGERSLPRLSVTLGLTSFGYGAVIGVLLQIQGALGTAILTGDSVGAHAGAMTFGYLVLVAMGLLEWRILGTGDLPRGGVAQVLLLFAGGLTISIGLLAGAAQAAGGIYLLTQLVAVILFIARVWPTSLRTRWLAADPARHFGIASVWVVGALILFMYLVASFITAADPNDPNAFPTNVLIASDHSVYIGVITNIVVGLLSLLVLGAAARSWVGQLTFWGINLGLVVFVIGLILDTAEIKRVGAPLMGITLLITLAILAWRAWSSTLDTSALEA